MVAKSRFRRVAQLMSLLIFLGLIYNFAFPLAVEFLDLGGKEIKIALQWRYAGGGVAILALLMIVSQRRKIIKQHRLFDQALAANGTTRLILLRSDSSPVKVSQVTLWSRLVDVIPLGEFISYELSGGQLGVAFSMRAMEETSRAIMTQIMGEWSGTRASIIEVPQDDPLFVSEGDTCYWLELNPYSTERTIEASVSDPLMTVLTQISQLPGGTRAGLQVLVRPDTITRQQMMNKAARLTAAPTPKGSSKSAEQKRMEKNIDNRSQRVFSEARLLVWATCSTPDTAKSTAVSLARTVISQYGPSNPIRISTQGFGSLFERSFPAFLGKPWADDELATIAHLLGQDALAIAPQIRVAPAKSLPPAPPNRIPENARTYRVPGDTRPPQSGDPWIVLGDYRDEWGVPVPVGFPLKDLTVHMSMLGTTGSGKSTLSRNLILQAFDLGSTAVVIEPHGDLILDPKEGILSALPPEVLANTAVIDLTSPWPPQINMVSTGLGAGISTAVDTAMMCVRVMEEASWSTAVQMREILENSLYLLLDVFGSEACMVHLMRFLTDAPYRDKIVSQASDSVGEQRSYWTDLIAQMEEAKGKKPADFSVPLRRIRKALNDVRFRRSLALPSLGNELQVSTLLDSGKPGLLLVPLQASKLGDEAKRVFGTLFMQMISNAFMSRADQAATSRNQTIVMIDEFADLAGGAVGDLVRILLAQARKFGASLILATQSMSQLPGDVMKEVRGNTNLKIVLLTSGADDAREATRNLGTDQLADKDILGIERFHAYARTMVHKQPQPTFYYANLPPIRQLTGNNYARGWDTIASPPDISDEFRKLHSLADSDPTGETVIKRLLSVDNQTFLGLAQEQVSAGHYQSDVLLSDGTASGIDPIQRALMVSRFRFGMPWWFYEAYYRRLRFS
jgi:hypothetical protein